MADEISPGDVVKLISEVSNYMTVGTIEGSDARCYWFNGANLTEAIIPMDALEVVVGG